MKAAALKKLITKLMEKEPIETGCKFHGDLVPSGLMIEFDGDVKVTLDDSVKNASVEDDCLVLEGAEGCLYYPLDRVKEAFMSYKEAK